MHRSINQAGLDLIKKHEGFVPQVYICPAGYPTIGYGHLIKPSEKLIFISQKEAEEILKRDVYTAERAVLRLINIPLTDNQFSALVSFTFNLGSGALQRSTLRMKVNRSEHNDVPNEFFKWVFAGGRKLKGLERRREEEALLYYT